MKRLMIFCNILILWCLIFTTTSQSADWYDARWKNRKLVSCTNPVSGYVMSENIITLYAYDDTQTDAGEVDLQGLCNGDFSDVIITEADGVTLAKWDYGTLVPDTSLQVIANGDGDKYVYFNSSASSTIASVNTTVFDSTLQIWRFSGAYAAEQNKLYFTWQNASYDPLYTYYDTTTGVWADDFYVVDEFSFEDVHSCPATCWDGTYLHFIYGGHNTANLYKRYRPTVASPQVVETFDYTGFTESDPSSTITVSASEISFAALDPRDVTSYVYKNQGAAYYDADFVFTTSINITSIPAMNVGGFWALSNAANKDIAGMNTAADDYLAMYVYRSATENQIALLQRNGAALIYDTYVTTDLTLGFEIYRDESHGTYGTLYCRIYSTPVYTEFSSATLLDTLVLTLTEKQDFQYLYSLITQDTNSAAATMGGSFGQMVERDDIQTINQLETMASPLSGTYPQISYANGKMWVFYREAAYDGWMYKTSTNNGTTWSAATKYIEADGYHNPYQMYSSADAAGNLWVCWDWYEPEVQSNGLFAMKYDEETDNRWEKPDGSAIGAEPVAYNDADALVFTSNANPNRHYATMCFDGASAPAIISNKWDGTYNDLVFTRWDAGAWSAPVDIISNCVGGGAVMALMFCESGSGATATYSVYTGCVFDQHEWTVDYTYSGKKYTSTDGGATWTESTWTAENVGFMAYIQNGTAATSLFTYVVTPDVNFPSIVKVYPEPENTFWRTDAGNVYTFQDTFTRAGLSDSTTSDYSMWWALAWYNTALGDMPTITDGKLTFNANIKNAGDYIKTNGFQFDVSGYSGYHVHFEMPGINSANAYTFARFGITGDTTDNNDQLLLKIDTSGDMCDVDVIVAGTSKINDDDNAIAADDFDIFVLFDAGGDQITIKNGGSTIYTGTIPDSVQMDQTIDFMMDSFGSGGTSSIVYFDNVSLSPWDSTSPTWSASGALESARKGTALMLSF